MEFSFTIFAHESKYTKFKIYNFELIKLIIETIDHIFIEYEICIDKPTWKLILYIILRKETQQIGIKRGGISNKNQVIEFGLCLPTQSFIDDEDKQQGVFINLFFEGLIKLFHQVTLFGKKYNIPEKKFDEAKNIIIQKISQDPHIYKPTALE